MPSAPVLVALLVLAELHVAGAVRSNEARVAASPSREAGKDVGGHAADQDVGQESLALAGAGGVNGTALARGGVGGEACGYDPGRPQVGLVDPENGQLFRLELNEHHEPHAAVLEELVPLRGGSHSRQVFAPESQHRVLRFGAPSGVFAGAFEVTVAGIAGLPSSVWNVHSSRALSGIWTRHSWRVADCAGNTVFTVNQQHGRDEVWKVYLGSKRDERHLYWARLSYGSTDSCFNHFVFTFYMDPKLEHSVARLEHNDLEYKVLVGRPGEDAGIILIASALIAKALDEKWSL